MAGGLRASGQPRTKQCEKHLQPQQEMWKRLISSNTNIVTCPQPQPHHGHSCVHVPGTKSVRGLAICLNPNLSCH